MSNLKTMILVNGSVDLMNSSDCLIAQNVYVFIL